MAINLSEYNIKKATLSFLKTHYRDRSRSDKSITRIGSDYTGEKGVIADGYISFLQENDEEFIATFEASSYDTEHELRYITLNSALHWDALALTFMLSLASLATMHYYGIYPVLLITLIPALAIGIGSLFLFYAISTRILGKFGFKRYRYIYAVEQFKQYHADEQWIAFGEDVFPNSDDPDFIELKRQCIQFGFGLIIVSRQLQCRTLLTPPLNDLFKGKRKAMEFHSHEEFEQQENKKKEQESDLTHYIKGDLIREETKRLLTFRSNNMRQAGIILGSIIGMITLAFLQYQNQPINYVDEDDFIAELEEKEYRPEPAYYIIDTPTKIGEFDIHPHLIDSIPTIIKEGEKHMSDIIIAERKKDAMLFYDCSRFANLTGTNYIVQDTVMSSFNATVHRIRQLKEINLEASAIWKGCINNIDQNGYIIFFDEVYTDSLQADNEALYIQSFARNHAFTSQAKLAILNIK